MGPAGSLPPDGIRTEGGFTPEDLVGDIFAKGVCNNIDNVKSIGPNGGIGFFENGMASIGLESGIILSTGPIQNAHPPNNRNDRSGNFDAPGDDPDLLLLATGPLKDAVGLEFDFTPLDSFVTFRYVFASEEYCEFAGSQYNDVFGFFVSGPGIDGAFSNKGENVALIPGTESFVAINSVNHYVNSNLYVRNERKVDWEKCNLPELQVSYHDQIQYDGFTTIFTALLKLAPCHTYHMRMVVADVGDADYDSAVFLEAESFNIGNMVELTAGPETREGCPDGYFLFNRTSDSPIQLPLTVAYQLSPSGTAQEGLDFASLGGTITIPAGQMSARLPVEVFNDGLPEGVEYLGLELDIPCACYSDSSFLYISDPEPIHVDLPTGLACPGEAARLKPSVVGGVPPFSYLWSTGATDSVIFAPGEPAMTYHVTVTDACMQTNSAQTSVVAAEAPLARLSGDYRICPGDTAHLLLELSGHPPWVVEYSVGGGTPRFTPPVYSSPYFIASVQGGLYEIESVSDAACTGAFSGVARVEILGPSIEAVLRPTTCFDFRDGEIEVILQGGAPPFQIHWSPDIGNGLQINNLAAGDYSLTVSDAQGCSVARTFSIDQPPALKEIRVDCEMVRGAGNFNPQPTGGAPPYRYALTPDGPWQSEDFFNQLVPGRQYPIFIRDANDCTLSQDFWMPVQYERMVEMPGQLSLRWGESLQMPVVLNIPETLISSIRWLPEAGLSCSNCLQPVLTGPSAALYTLYLSDIFGCTEERSLRIEQSGDLPIYIPNAFSPDGDQFNDRFRIFPVPGLIRIIKTYQVFDRWGGLLFAATDLDPYSDFSGWDGMVNRRPAEAGVYTFWMELELADGNAHIIKGSVVLMR